MVGLGVEAFRVEGLLRVEAFRVEGLHDGGSDRELETLNPGP